jgi:hypothetical protein
MIRKGGYSSVIDGEYHTFLGTDKAIEEIRMAINEVLEYAENMEKKNIELESSLWKDQKLQEMKDKLDQAKEDNRRGFPIGEQEKEAISDWKTKHCENKHNGAKRVYWEYEFCPTELGIVGIVVCPVCREKMRQELGFENDYPDFSKYHDKKRELISKYDCEFDFREL